MVRLIILFLRRATRAECAERRYWSYHLNSIHLCLPAVAAKTRYLVLIVDIIIIAYVTILKGAIFAVGVF